MLSRIDVDMVYLPKGEEMESCRSALRETGAHDIEIVDADTTISWGDAKLTLYTFGAVESSNESSLCILFQKENYDILITGDQTQLGEKVLLHGNDLPQIDVLVVGHHGADTSTGAWFLSQLRPAVAVISVGRDNPYGHPQAGVLQRLEDHNQEVIPWRSGMKNPKQIPCRN